MKLKMRRQLPKVDNHSPDFEEWQRNWERYGNNVKSERLIMLRRIIM